MAERVFPSSGNVDMGSKISFSGIDWNDVEQKMNNNRFADDGSSKIMELIEQLTGIPAEKIEEMAHEMGGGEPDGDEMPDFGHDEPDGDEMPDFGHDEPDGDEMGDEPDFDHDVDHEKPAMGKPIGEKEMNMPLPDMGHEGMEMPMKEKEESHEWRFSADGKTKKIAFTNANQINADAVEKAIASGDKKLASTILAARKANRVRMAKTLEAKIASGKPNRIAQMSADSFGKYDLDTLGFMAKSFGDNVPPALKTAIANKQGKNMKLSFTDPTKFSQAQRASFTKIAMELGMPSEYVSAMCEPILSEQVSNLNSEIKAIHASTVSASTKNSLIKMRVNTPQLQSLMCMLRWTVHWGYFLIMKVSGLWQLVVHLLQTKR